MSSNHVRNRTYSIACHCLDKRGTRLLSLASLREPRPFRHHPLPVSVGRRPNASACPRTASPTRSPSTFPSVDHVVERMRDAFLGERVGRDVLTTEAAAVAPRGAPRPRRAARGAVHGTCRELRRARRDVDRAVRVVLRHRRHRWSTIPCECRCRPASSDGARVRFRVTAPRRVAGARRGARRHSFVGRVTERLAPDAGLPDPRCLIPSSSRRMASHVDFVGILFIVWGAADGAHRPVDARARHRRRRAHHVCRATAQAADSSRPA